jgi:hypothetical protein
VSLVPCLDSKMDQQERLVFACRCFNSYTFRNIRRVCDKRWIAEVREKCRRTMRCKRCRDTSLQLSGHFHFIKGSFGITGAPLNTSTRSTSVACYCNESTMLFCSCILHVFTTCRIQIDLSCHVCTGFLHWPGHVAMKAYRRLRLSYIDVLGL